jgi:thiamine transporter ThiT
MRRGRPALGAFGGLLLGIGVAVLIQQYGLWPLDPLLAYGLPALFLLLGVVFARWAPFGGG